MAQRADESEQSRPPDSLVLLQDSTAVPADEELISLRSAKEAKEAKRNSVQDEVDHLLRVVEERRKELQELDSEIEAYAYVVSPLRRIPPDTLRDIFSYAIPYTVAGIRDTTLFAPWTLLRVCKHWRNVGLMYGSLWSDIHIDVDDDQGVLPERPSFHANGPLPHPMDDILWASIDGPYSASRAADTVSREAELLELKLQRSQSADLTVTISPRMRQNYAQPFLRIILPHLHRCIYLSAPFHIIGHAPFASRLQSLKHVVVDYTCAEYTLVHPSVTPPINIATTQKEEAETMASLGSLNLSTFSAILSSYRANPVLYQPRLLTSLTIFNVRPRGIHIASDLLPQLESIRELQLFGSAERPTPLNAGANDVTPTEPQQILPRVVLGQLTSLKVAGKVLVSQVLSSITAPSLSILDCPGFVEPQVLDEFLEVSTCRIRALGVDLQHDIDSLPGPFRATHSWEHLENLRIHETPLSRISNEKVTAASAAMLSLLTQSVDQPSDKDPSDPFPSLLHLDLGPVTCTVSEVIRLLTARRAQGRGHKKLMSCKINMASSLQRRYTEAERTQMKDEQQVRRILCREVELEPAGFEADNFAEWRRVLLNAMTMRASAAWRGPDWSSRRSLQNTQLTWAEALEKEGDQMVKMDELQSDGLEVWLRPMRKSEKDLYTWSGGAQINVVVDTVF